MRVHPATHPGGLRPPLVDAAAPLFRTTRPALSLLARYSDARLSNHQLTSIRNHATSEGSRMKARAQIKTDITMKAAVSSRSLEVETRRRDSDEVRHVHRHLVNLGRVVLLDVAQDADVVALDEVDGDALAAEAA